MQEPNIELPLEPQWLFAGHHSSNLAELKQLFSVSSETLELNEALTDPIIFERLQKTSSVALFINAKTGVSKEMIHFWQYISERLFPRMIVVTGLEFSEADFDDIVLIANRVLEQVVTPYLVLHDELGEPSGLISLLDSMVYDYSAIPMNAYLADVDLRELITEFENEYKDATVELGADAFEAGLLVPAIPLVPNRGIGITEIQNFFERIK